MYMGTNSDKITMCLLNFIDQLPFQGKGGPETTNIRGVIVTQRDEQWTTAPP